MVGLRYRRADLRENLHDNWRECNEESVGLRVGFLAELELRIRWRRVRVGHFLYCGVFGFDLFGNFGGFGLETSL